MLFWTNLPTPLFQDKHCQETDLMTNKPSIQDQADKVPNRKDRDHPRILVIGPYPPPYAGPELAIKNLLESPINDTFQAAHLSTNVRKSNADKGKVNATLFIAFFKFVSRLIGALLRHRPQVVYYFVTATRLGWMGRDIWCIALSRLFGAKVVTHMRAGHFAHEMKKASRFETAIIKWACHRASFNLVQAPSLKDQFEGLSPPEKIAVVPNMINTHLYPAVPAQDYVPKRVFFMGHLSVAKGYCEMLKIIPQIAQKHPDVLFQFAGTKKFGKDRNVRFIQSTGAPLPPADPIEDFDAYVKNRFESNYEYLGVLAEAEKIETMKNCDIFVLPSFSEGFSMAILEALCMSKPVVCTAVGAMRDFVIPQKNGEVIEPADTEALATAIDTLLSNRPYRNKIAAFNGAYIRENFSQAAVAAQLADIFNRALDKS